MGTRHQPHCACFRVLACLAVRAAGGRTGGAAYLALMWDVLVWALTHPQPPVSRRCDRGPLHTGSECGGCGHGDPSATPRHALLRAGVRT